MAGAGGGGWAAGGGRKEKTKADEGKDSDSEAVDRAEEQNVGSKPTHEVFLNIL